MENSYENHIKRVKKKDLIILRVKVEVISDHVVPSLSVCLSLSVSLCLSVCLCLSVSLSLNIDRSTFFKYQYIINIVRYFHGRNFHKDMFLRLCG